MARVEGRHPLQRVRRAHRCRLGQRKRARGDRQILVHAQPFPFPDSLQFGQVYRFRRDDILHAQQVQQRRIQRLPILDGLHAVEGEFVLRFDGRHVGGVLFGDDRLVATHILQVIRPTGVGVEWLLPLWVERGKAPHTRLLGQPLQQRRLEGEQLRIDGGVETGAGAVQVRADEGGGGGQPQEPAGAPRRAAEPEQSAGDDEDQPQDQQLPEFIAVKGAGVGECVCGQRQPAEDALDDGGEGVVEEAGDGEAKQQQSARAHRQTAQPTYDVFGGGDAGIFPHEIRAISC